MNKEEIERFKQKLIEERNEIIKQMIEEDETAKEILEKDLQNVMDNIDEATTSISQTILNISNANHKQTLLAIDAALRRIEEGNFGNCVGCGEPISLERLELIPWATMCIKCKNQQEKSAHSHNHK